MVPKSKLKQAYLKYALMSPEFQAQLEAHGTGTTVKGIKSSVLKNLTIPIPALDEQGRAVTWIEDRYSAAESIEATLAAQLQQAVRLRQAVLKRAFEGRLV